MFMCAYMMFSFVAYGVKPESDSETNDEVVKFRTPSSDAQESDRRSNGKSSKLIHLSIEPEKWQIIMKRRIAEISEGSRC